MRTVVQDAVYFKEATRRYRERHPERVKELAKAWRIANPDKVRAMKQRYRAANAEKLKAARRAQYIKNHARETEKRREWQAAHKAEMAAYQSARIKADPIPNRMRRSLRRAAEKRAIPSWADRAKIKGWYVLAGLVTEETGVTHHVDHIVPLKSDIVCGLHCEANLQVIPAFDNQSKRNFYWPDMPDQMRA